MALNILNITPVDKSINIPIDSSFLIEFDSPVDPFSILSGISIYTISDGLWSGPDTAILENSGGTTGDYLQSSFNYTIQDNKVFIKSLQPLLAEKTYFITILPGDDATRFISSTTVSEPIYIRSIASSGTCEIVSSYIGTTNDTFAIYITAGNKIDVTKGVNYLGEFNYVNGQEVDLGELKISLNGTFDIGDGIDINVFKAGGVSSIYKTSFETSKYTTLIPQSQSLTTPPGNILSQLILPLSIVSTIPDNLSANNNKCNPIIIKFNKNISPSDNIEDKINIKRISMDTSRISSISFYYKINNNILKLFMTSVS
jgi:hypothetical protein